MGIKGDRYETRIELDADNVDWFVTNYGPGKLWWLLDNLLAAFRNAHELTPQELIVKGAEALKDCIDKGDS